MFMYVGAGRGEGQDEGSVSECVEKQGCGRGRVRGDIQTLG